MWRNIQIVNKSNAPAVRYVFSPVEVQIMSSQSKIVEQNQPSTKNITGNHRLTLRSYTVHSYADDLASGPKGFTLENEHVNSFSTILVQRK